MILTGTLIEDLMATVERAERKAQSDDSSWHIANHWQSIPGLLPFNENYRLRSKLLGVA